MSHYIKPPVGTPLDYANPLIVGLIGFWPMWEKGGLGIKDISVNKNHALGSNITQGATSGWIGNIFGGGLIFDGVDDKYDMVSEDNLNAANLTISAWVKLTANQTTRIFIAKFDQPTSNGWGFGIDDVSTNKIKFYTDGAGASNTLTSATALTNGVWYHVAVTYDGANKKIYINGIEDATVGYTDAIIYTGTQSSIGYAKELNSQFLNGQLAEVRVWNRVLSANEIRNMYINPFGIFLYSNISKRFISATVRQNNLPLLGVS